VAVHLDASRRRCCPHTGHPQGWLASYSLVFESGDQDAASKPDRSATGRGSASNNAFGATWPSTTPRPSLYLKGKRAIRRAASPVRYLRKQRCSRAYSPLQQALMEDRMSSVRCDARGPGRFLDDVRTTSSGVVPETASELFAFERYLGNSLANPSAISTRWIEEWMAGAGRAVHGCGLIVSPPAVGTRLAARCSPSSFSRRPRLDEAPTTVQPVTEAPSTDWHLSSDEPRTARRSRPAQFLGASRRPGKPVRGAAGPHRQARTAP